MSTSRQARPTENLPGVHREKPQRIPAIPESPAQPTERHESRHDRHNRSSGPNLRNQAQNFGRGSRNLPQVHGLTGTASARAASKLARRPPVGVGRLPPARHRILPGVHCTRPCGMRDPCSPDRPLIRADSPRVRGGTPTSLCRMTARSILRPLSDFAAAQVSGRVDGGPASGGLQDRSGGQQASPGGVQARPGGLQARIGDSSCCYSGTYLPSRSSWTKEETLKSLK